MLYKPVGMSMEESLKTDIEVENVLLKEFPELTRIFSRIGTSEIATDPMPPNESDVYIFYKPIKEWSKTSGRPRTKAELREHMEASLKKINPDYTLLFAQPIEMRFNEMLEGTKAELAVKIFGDDFDVLETMAEQIKGILEKMPDTAQVEFETEGRTPQLQINAKRDALQKYALQAGEVNKTINTALGGQEVGKIIEGNKRWDIIVRMPEQLREEGKSVRDTIIEGSLTRLRPVLMTALVASFGFVPMALATGAGAEVQKPLAIVVIGGLISSMFLKLVLLPVLYEWVENKAKPRTADTGSASRLASNVPSQGRKHSD